MRVLTSGGAGYVGSVLIPVLIAAGHKVRVFDPGLFGFNRLIEDVPGVEIVRGFIERESPHDLLDGVDAVVHLAAYSNDPTAEFSPERTYAVNVEGTRLLVAACERSQVQRFILASSASLYDVAGENTDVLDETAPVSPQSTYSRSKLDAEQIVLGSSIPCPVVLRKGTIFGWSPRMRYDLVVNTMVRDAMLDGVIRIVDEGQMWRPLVHVQDVAAAYLRALALPSEAVRHQVLNVLHSNWQIKEVAETVHTACKRFGVACRIESVPPKGKVRDYRIVGDKFFSMGFCPHHDIRAGAMQILVRAAQGSKRDLVDPRRENIAWLRLMQEAYGLFEAGFRP